MLNFNFLMDVSEGWARFWVIMAFIVPMVGAFLMPHKYIYQGAPDNKIWRNLKLWVFVIVAVQVGIYLYF